MDLVLAASFSPAKLCDLLKTTELPTDKKEWVIMALVEVVEHDVFNETGGIDEALLKPVSEVLRSHADLCRGVIPHIGVGNNWILKQIVETDFPHGFTTLDAAHEAAFSESLIAPVNPAHEPFPRKRWLVMLVFLLVLVLLFYFAR